MTTPFDEQLEKIKELRKENLESAYELTKEVITQIKKTCDGIESYNSVHVDIFHHFGTICQSIGKCKEGLEQITPIIENLPSSVNQALEAKVRQGFSNLLSDAGHFERTLEEAKIALKIYEEIGDENGIGGIVNNIALVLTDLGRFEEALENYERAIAIFRKKKDKEGTAEILNNIGILYRVKGDIPHAIEALGEGLILAKNLELHWLIGAIENNFADLLMLIGQVQEAISHYKTGLRYFKKQKFNDPVSIAISFCNLGEAYFILNHISTSQSYLKEGIQLYEEVGVEDENLFRALMVMSEISANEDQWDQSWQYIKRIEELANKHQTMIEKTMVLYQKARILRLESSKEAKSYKIFLEALNLALKIEYVEIALKSLVALIAINISFFHSTQDAIFLEIASGFANDMKQIAKQKSLLFPFYDANIISALIERLRPGGEGCAGLIDLYIAMGRELPPRIQLILEKTFSSITTSTPEGVFRTIDDYLEETSRYLRFGTE